MKQNMINGSPVKSLVFFALPMVIGNLFQQFYNIVDSMVVGNFVGEDALAAVGASYSVTMLFIAVATGAGIGCSVMISQLFGAKQLGRMKTAISTALLSIGALSIILMVFGLAISHKLLIFMGTPTDLIGDGTVYLRIYFMGLLFLFMYNILNSIFNALGESRVPLYFLIFSSIINIILDLLFVIAFQMGVAGVAWATLIAQGISACLSSICLFLKLRKIQIPENQQMERRVYSLPSLLSMCRIAIPSTIQQSIVSIGFLLVQVVINRYGASVMAGYTAASKIDSMAIMPMISVGNAISTFTAQNIGAGKPDRVKRGYHTGLFMVAVIGLTITFLLYLFGDFFIGAFLDSESSREAISTGVEYLRVVSIFYVLMGIMNVTNGILRGSGYVGIFMASTLFNFTTRVLLAHLLSLLILQKAVWWSIPIGWAVGYIIAAVGYYRGKWKNIKIIP